MVRALASRCPWVNFWTLHLIWVQFVGSLLSPRGFSLVTSVFPSTQAKNPTFLNSNSIENPMVTVLSAIGSEVLPSLNKVELLYVI